MTGQRGGSPAFEVVLASAGTGKTFALTNRLAGLLARGVPVERILAATFTRKAAGEIRERLLSRIAQAAMDGHAAEDLSRHVGVDFGREQWLSALRRLARGIHRVRIGTLDSVAQGLARSLAPDLGLAAPWRLAMDHDLDRLRSEVVDQVLGDCTTDEERSLLHTLADSTGGAASDKKLQRLIADAGPIVRSVAPDAWACLAEEARHGPSVADMRSAFERLAALEGPINKSGSPDKRFLNARAKLGAQIEAGDFEGLLKSTLVSAADSPQPLYHKVEVPESWIPELLTIYRGAKRAALETLHERNLAACDLLTRAAAIDDRMRRAWRMYGLDDLWRALAGAHLDAAHVAYQLDAQFDHVLLDEFQDTSIDQWRVLEPLIDEAVAGGERDRSVFVVGDVKQSLYGWRDAQAELLPFVARRWQQMETSTLRKTYRCAPGIVQAVNTVFGGLIENPALTDHARAAARFAKQFEEHESAVRSASRVRVVNLSALEAAANDAAETQGEPIAPADPLELVAERVAEFHRAHPGQDVALLVRRQKPIGGLVAALQARGVPAVADAASSPCDHPVVEVVLSALKLSAHPRDGAARFAVATSPLGRRLGLTGVGDRAAGARVGRDIAGRVFEDGLAAAVEWLAAEAGSETNDRGRQRLGDLIEHAETYERDAAEWAGVDDFIASARQARVRPRGQGLVRVLTMHGSKGLQFDAVFLADLDSSLAKRLPPLLTDAATEHDPAAAAQRVSLAGVSAVRQHSDVLRAMEARYRARVVYEELCLLYVGMTRAKTRLEMFVRPDETGLGAVAWHGLGASGEGLEIDHPGLPTPAEPPKARPEPSVAPAWAVKAGALARPSAGEPWRVAMVRPSDRGERRGVAALLQTRAAAADIGSEVHRLLEGVAWLESAPADPDAWSDHRTASTAEAASRIAAALAEGSLARVLSKAWLHEHWDGQLELEVLTERDIAAWVETAEARVLVRGRIDRLVVGRAGGVVRRCMVVDFKTGQAARDGASQVALYQKAVAALYGLASEAVVGLVVSI
ncbi:MAG: UvrD-helicase domain-containing protein [Phycisphaerales bacterium]